MTSDYLVVYDYGMGGVWAIIRAESESQIRQKYPALEVVDDPPPSITKERMDEIRQMRFINVNDEPVGWFKSVAQKGPIEGPPKY